MPGLQQLVVETETQDTKYPVHKTVVEDNLKDAIRWLGKSRTVLVFNHPWNRSHNIKNLFRRVNNWHEIIEIVDTLEK